MQKRGQSRSSSIETRAWDVVRDLIESFNRMASGQLSPSLRARGRARLYAPTALALHSLQAEKPLPGYHPSAATQRAHDHGRLGRGL
jgi:hypothetical protein